MIRGSTFLSVSALIAGTVALAGCSNWSYAPPMHGNFMTEPVNHSRVDAGSPPAGGAFIQETAHDYAGLADYLSHHGAIYQGDWVDVDYFARKGIAAEHGVLVPPEDNANWAIPLEQPYRLPHADGAARSARDRSRQWRPRSLPGPRRTRSGRIRLLAQSTPRTIGEGIRWPMPSGFHRQHHRARTGAQRQGRRQPRRPHQYNVCFEFDRSTLTPEGKQVVDTVAGAAKGNGDTIRLVGKADLTGTDPYNMARCLIAAPTRCAPNCVAMASTTAGSRELCRAPRTAGADSAGCP